VYKGVKAATYKPIKNLFSLLVGKKLLSHINLSSKVED
jgi:hypothetical protein